MSNNDNSDDATATTTTTTTTKTDQSSNELALSSAEFLESIKTDVIRCGRIIYPNKNVTFPSKFDLPAFLRLFPPTKIVVPGCHWIQVHNRNRKRRLVDEDTNHDDDENDGSGRGDDDCNYEVGTHKEEHEDNPPQEQPKAKQKEEQQQEESPHDVLLDFAKFGNQRVSAATKQTYRDRLLASAKDTYGKWMIFPNSQNVNAIWNEIATKVFHGELGCSAKVNNKAPVVSRSTSSDKKEDVKKWYERKKDDEDDEEEDDSYVICVYVDDFRNVEDVRRVLRVLLRIEGVTINAGFKVRTRNEE